MPLGRWPTPIRRLQLGSGDLPVKDEGQASPIYGGNKVRKLERSLAVLLDPELPSNWSTKARGSLARIVRLE